jgi:hypothetical protein
MAHDIFISYSSKDKPVADAVCARLESRAIRCWIAPRDVPPGANYGGAIIDAIQGSRVMVLVLSASANVSPHIPNEIERAVSYGVAILPFRIEDVKPAKSLDLFIGSVHWLDALTPPLERHLDRLADSASKLLSDRTHPDPPPPPIPSPIPPPVPPANWYKPAAIAGAILAALVLGWSLSSRNGAPATGSADTGAAGVSSPPPAASSAAQAITGCWRWSNSALIVIRPNGTMTAAAISGEWRHTGGQSYAFTWPEPVDTLTMSSNRQMLRGSNQYGVAVTATRVSGGPDLPGSWKWGGVLPVEISASGTVNMGALAGSWELADAGQRLYRVTWPKIQDEVTLSADQNSLKTMNQYGAAFSGSRASCP